MIFKVYTGEIASNASVNISCHGSFEAKDVPEAIRKINVNIKHQYCKAWQFPSVQDPNTCEWIRPDYIQCFHDNLPANPFVCIGDPFMKNVIWKSNKACISFFQT